MKVGQLKGVKWAKKFHISGTVTLIPSKFR